MSVLTIYFEIDQSFASVKANSKLVQYVSDNDVLVSSRRDVYEGRIIGRSGILFFFCM